MQRHDTGTRSTLRLATGMAATVAVASLALATIVTAQHRENERHQEERLCVKYNRVRQADPGDWPARENQDERQKSADLHVPVEFPE